MPLENWKTDFSATLIVREGKEEEVKSLTYINALNVKIQLQSTWESIPVSSFSAHEKCTLNVLYLTDLFWRIMHK